MKHNKGDKKISAILNNLIRSDRFKKEHKPAQIQHGPILTSLGVPLIEQSDGLFFIDVTNLRLFSGMPGFVNYLAKQTLEQCRNSSTDVLTQVIVDSDITPELALLGVGHVAIYSRGAVAKHIVDNQHKFIDHLRLSFSALQTPQWGNIICRGEKSGNADESGNMALYFPFSDEEGKPFPYFFLLEYEETGKYLRITVEDSKETRLFLKRIPHRAVKDTGKIVYQQDISAIVDQIFTGIHRECQDQHYEYTEIPGRQSALFEALIASGLRETSGVVFRWTKEIAEKILLQDNKLILSAITKSLLLLEDENIILALSNNNSIEMLDSGIHVYIDLSRKGKIVNISLGEQRKQPDIMHHLMRMPSLHMAVQNSNKNLLQKYRVLLIHHATSEVLGFVKALQEAKCPAVTTLFIRYRGIVPGPIIEDMLSMPENNFQFYGLQRVERRSAVQGSYILSRQYSSIESLKRLDYSLRNYDLSYLKSMRLAGLHLFFRDAFQALKEGRSLLLIEDGGYIAPMITTWCHANMTLHQVLEECEFDIDTFPAEDIDFKDWLYNVMPVSFEHTANGYYQLKHLENEFGKIYFPIFTIALSKFKNIVEAESCAYSIINAILAIFYGLGKCIMHRHALVLGSRGNIGKFLFRSIAKHVSYGTVHGLDLKVNPAGDNDAEFSDIDEIPDDVWKKFDFFVGITGVSVLKQSFYEKLILQGRSSELFFASGSTKTIEFSDLTDWLTNLSQNESPVICGHPVSLQTSPIMDPQTGLLQGHRIRITFVKPESVSGISVDCPYKDLFMLGDSMPINFLYYGVPGEIIDGVFEELFSLVLGALNEHENGVIYEPMIYALDENIDKDGKRKSQ